MKTKLMLLVVLATIFAGCQKEESELRGPDGRESASGVRVVIDGEKALRTETTRAGGTKVYFEGGYATGAGLYDTKNTPIVEAHPDEGYEVDYFYGGPQNEPKRYDYAKSDSASFGVDLSRGDHLFHCGFKKYEGPKLKLRAVPEEGGVLEIVGKIPTTGEYKVVATPNEGYGFGGAWRIASGDAGITLNMKREVHVKMNTSTSVLEALFGRNSSETGPSKPGTINVTVLVTGANDSNVSFSLELKDNTGKTPYRDRVARGSNFYNDYTFSNAPRSGNLYLSEFRTIHYTPDIYTVKDVTVTNCGGTLTYKWAPGFNHDGILLFESETDVFITIDIDRKIMPMP
ncbi:hypothetical protein [Bacteroides sp. Marseille-P3684]|uniref:InlB B-repeat-containing protein n=1 Tax=Bacteroides sp. Marseille-P3684 TaxID=2086579 RepID=UPI000D0AC486|nr:hypothetical protein [Bacteroides sp. Marseille-P3684]